MAQLALQPSSCCESAATVSKILLAGVALATTLVASADARADVGLPKKFRGKWCADTHVGGASKFWHFLRGDHCGDRPDYLKELDMVIGYKTLNNCKVIKVVRYYSKDFGLNGEDFGLIYRVTMRCKNEENKIEIWLESDGIGMR
jgi:hypothetical protein